MRRDDDIAAVAAAALAWNRARLVRIAMTKRVVPWPHLQYRQTQAALAHSKAAEAKALAALRKACTKADPTPITINAEPLPAAMLEGLNHGL